MYNNRRADLYFFRRDRAILWAADGQLWEDLAAVYRVLHSVAAGKGVCPKCCENFCIDESSSAGLSTWILRRDCASTHHGPSMTLILHSSTSCTAV
jgi:hypothetical protein